MAYIANPVQVQHRGRYDDRAVLAHNSWGCSILTLQFPSPSSQATNDMRLSQVLVIAVASFLFASDTAAAAPSNQAKISKMAESTPSQRLLRSHKYLVEEEEGQSEDSVDVEKSGFATRDEEDLEERSPLSSATVEKLDKIARGWGTTYAKVAMGLSPVSTEKAQALLKLRDAYISGDRSAKQAAKMALLLVNKS